MATASESQLVNGHKIGEQAPKEQENKIVKVIIQVRQTSSGMICVNIPDYQNLSDLGVGEDIKIFSTFAINRDSEFSELVEKIRKVLKDRGLEIKIVLDFDNWFAGGRWSMARSLPELERRKLEQLLPLQELESIEQLCEALRDNSQTTIISPEVLSLATSIAIYDFTNKSWIEADKNLVATSFSGLDTNQGAQAYLIKLDSDLGKITINSFSGPGEMEKTKCQDANSIFIFYLADGTPILGLYNADGVSRSLDSQVNARFVGEFFMSMLQNSSYSSIDEAIKAIKERFIIESATFWDAYQNWIMGNLTNFHSRTTGQILQWLESGWGFDIYDLEGNLRGDLRSVSMFSLQLFNLNTGEVHHFKSGDTYTYDENDQQIFINGVDAQSPDAANMENVGGVTILSSEENMSRYAAPVSVEAVNQLRGFNFDPGRTSTIPRVRNLFAGSDFIDRNNAQAIMERLSDDDTRTAKNINRKGEVVDVKLPVTQTAINALLEKYEEGFEDDSSLLLVTVD